ncbi:hypothetical protein NHX12_010097 [Muraenolepis orangiensis]|uniref:Uncharacterized protein n=1 Tax=Muraenolepis orangiensis TaxID=630683 RepID=A0A9Q0DJ28_9TELE|nr:hypothetical protein NHX12_010097 [Muraenolepis orangiensis]
MVPPSARPPASCVKQPMLSGSRPWNQRRWRCCTPRLRESARCRLVPGPGVAWKVAHLERALTPRPEPLGTVGGATRDSGGFAEGAGERTAPPPPPDCATRRPERCSSRMLPAIR